MWPEFNMWAYGKLSWDPTIPLRKLISDFCQIAYRGAAQTMAEFHTTLERWKWEWPNHRPELETLLKQAEAQVRDDPTVASKLERLEKVLATDPGRTWPHASPPPPLQD